MKAGKTFLLLLFVALVTGTLQAQVTVSCLDLVDSEDARTRYLALPFKLWKPGQYRMDPATRTSVITLNNNLCGFGLTLSGKENVDGSWSASLGMPWPTQANWFNHSFLTFAAGELKSSQCHVQTGECNSGPQSGTAQINYTAQDFAASLQFTLLNEDDRLLLAFTVTKAPAGVQEYQLEFLCYPGSFGGGYQQGRDTRKRRVSTAEKAWAPGENQGNLEKSEAWVCFYDEYYDVDKNRGEGPCAALYNPMHTSAARVIAGEYASHLRLTYPVHQTAWVMLWEFKGWGNRAALEFMQALQIKHH